MPRLSKGDIAKIADAVVSRLQSTQPAIADSDDDLVETVRANMRQGRGTIIPELTAMPTGRIELPENEQPPLRESSQQNEFAVEFDETGTPITDFVEDEDGGIIRHKDDDE